MAEDRSNSAGHTTGSGNAARGQPVTPPDDLPGFPNATRVKGKTLYRAGKVRRRWKAPDGTILEWDYLHGRVEKYNSQGKHLGEYDPATGKQLGGADPSRQVEP